MTQSNLEKLQANHGPAKKQLFLLVIVAIGCFWILFQIDEETGTDFFKILYSDHKKESIQLDGFLINTKGCRIQDLDPFDPTVKAYWDYKEPPVCDKNGYGRLVVSTEDKLFVNESIVPHYSNSSTLFCCYTPFWRYTVPDGEPYGGDVDKQHEEASYCRLFFNAVIVEDEFVKVTCKVNSNVVYEDYFTFMQSHGATKLPSDNSKINVLVIGIDAVSRLNMHRMMPETTLYLKNESAIEMLGYNKVGDNTFPNLVPVLTGLSEEELIQSCWPETSLVFDNCNFVWDFYKKRNYTTGYGEDSADIGLFNYLKRGFRKKPTDYYLQTFNLLAENSIGKHKLLNTKICMGNRLTIESVIDAAKTFSINLKENLSFGFFWSTSLTHDYFNLPKIGDRVLKHLLIALKNNGVSNNSMIILMSDHGIRWGSYRLTYNGYLEERLPFLFFMVPKWFKEKYPYAFHNLRKNSRRLTTPFDLHEALIDLADLSVLENNALKKRALENTKQRGKSLFVPINQDRTCITAGIPQNWCTCHSSREIQTNNTKVKSSAHAIVTFLNDQLTGFKQCANLSLKKIKNARVEKLYINDTENVRVKKSAIIDHLLTIETEPGNAIFQTTVRYSFQSKNFTVIPPVSRLNTYGGQSNCISNYHLKLYCYCQSYWDKT